MEVTEESATKPRKRRPPWEKYGKYRYMYKLLHQLRRETNARLDHLEAQLNLLTAGLSDWLEPRRDYLVSVVCADEVDEALLWCMYSAGGVGISPSHVIKHPDLSSFRLKPWNITRRIQRMNKRLKKKFGKRVAEKRGRRWAMTSFVHSRWGAESRPEIDDNQNSDV